MKNLRILLLEDVDFMRKKYELQLDELKPDLRTSVKSWKQGQISMRDQVKKETPYNLIVCDHNFFMFDDSFSPEGIGHEFFSEVRHVYRRKDLELPIFIHFSAEPCPEKYEHRDETDFFSWKKGGGINIASWIDDSGTMKQAMMKRGML